MSATGLFRTTIEVWSAYDPRTRGGGMEIDALAEQAMSGDAYCTRQETVAVPVSQVDAVAEESATALLEFFGVGGSDPVDEEVAVASEAMRVRAEFRTDDGQYVFPFDAVRYFERASDADLIELRDVGWTGDYPSDNVAYALEDDNQALASALVYTAEHEVGWNVEVNAGDAERWVAEHRPALSGDAAEGDRS